jgi:hypothetical protein
MSPRLRIVIIALAAVTVLAAGAGYAYWFFLIRGPLAGETTHDFGDVPLYEQNVALEHTMRLRNRLSQPLTIKAIRPDCGCVTVAGGQRTLQPGEGFDLPITFMARSGPRTVPIEVLFADDTTQTLRVKANGKRQPRLFIHPDEGAITLDGAGAAEFVVAAETFDQYDAPPAPTISSSTDQLTAEFGEWSLNSRPKNVDRAPTYWQGHVRVRFKGESLPENSSLTVSMPPAKPLALAITR